MIADRYVKLDLPILDMHMVCTPLQNKSDSQMDAVCFTATM